MKSNYLWFNIKNEQNGRTVLLYPIQLVHLSWSNFVLNKLLKFMYLLAEHVTTQKKAIWVVSSHLQIIWVSVNPK